MNAEGGSLRSIETACEDVFRNVLETCVSFGVCLEESNEQKRGGNRMKSFYSIMWGNAVRVLRGRGACENTVGISMCDGPIETVKYIRVNI